MADAPVWTGLRQAVQDAHQAIESVPRLVRIFAADFTRDELAEILVRMAAIHRPLETALAAHPTVLWQGYRSRLPLIEAGLAHLDLAPGCPDISQEPVVDGETSALGVLYVLEGSTMGGQVITERLCRHFGDEIRPAIGFYTPYGAAAGERWRLVRTHLERSLAEPQALAAATAAALACFRFFEAGLRA